MDFKRILTLVLAIVMCVNVLASAFPSVAYASGGETQTEMSEITEEKASNDVTMEISGSGNGTGKISESGEETEKQTETVDTADTAETEPEVEAQGETDKAATEEVKESEEVATNADSMEETGSEPTEEVEELLVAPAAGDDVLARLKEMVAAFPEEPELWWLDEEELTTLYETFSEICDLYESLDEEAQAQVDMSKLEAAGEFFAQYVDPLALVNTGDIYSIPSEYGAGIIYQGKKSTAIYGSGWKDGRYATNHSKDRNVWIKYPESGSCYVDGQHVKADVLVYYWLSAGEAFVATDFGRDLVSIGSPAWCGYSPQDFTVEMEYHFFRAGTNEELTVDGYLFAHDLDVGEGICGKTGARGYYTSDNTTMKWKGQYVTGTVDDDRTDYSMSVGVAFHSEPSAPFHVSYHGCEYYSIELASVGVDGKLLKQYGSLNVTKSITNPSGYAASLAGFTMRLTGTSAYGDTVNQTAVTNASGVASFTKIPMGTYRVTEEGTASYWDIPVSGNVNVEPNQTITYSVNNIYKTGNVELTKHIETASEDAYNAEAEAAYHYNDSLSGFAYKLSGMSDSGIPVLKYGVTDEKGKLIFSNIPVGTYVVEEVKASSVPADAACKAQATQELYQYVIPEGQTVKVTYDDAAHKGNTSKITFENQLKKWSFSGKAEPDSLLKEDEEALAAGISQGDATLAGAVYGLYDGDKLIAKATTDEAGRFDFAGVYVVGDLWYVQEIKASEGYLLDPVKYPVKACALELTDEKDGIFRAELKNTMAGTNTVTEQVKKQALSFYKVTGTDKQSSFEAVAGAKFSVYLVSELADGKYADLSDAELPQAIMDNFRNSETLDYNAMRQQRPATVYADADSEDVVSGWLAKSVLYKDGTSYHAEGDHAYLVSEMVSDSKGVVTTPELPYGRYLVVETTTPENKIATRPFVLHVTGDDKDSEVKGDGQGQPLENLVIAVDKPITSLIRIRKQDAGSHKTVLKPGAGYVIHDTDGAWFAYCSAEWTSAQKKAYKDKYGDLVVQSSQGEMLGTSENPYVTRKIAQAESKGNVYVDTPAALPAGTYTLEEVAAPEGYVLAGHEGVIAKKTSVTEGNHTFYETETNGAWDKVENSTVKVVVSSEEAVYDRDADAFVTVAAQQNTPAIGKISIYAEGEQLVSAKQDGATILERLGDAVQNFFGYVKGLIGLDTPDEDGLTEKELSEYRDYCFSYELQPIEGAEFEIRAAEDIYSPEGGVNATKLFSKGDLVTTLTTNADGQTWTGQEDWEGTEIAKGLPLGKYTITHTKAGHGFALSAENAKPREVEIAYAGQEVPVIYRDSSFENPRQKVEIAIEKLDAEEKEPLAGAVFGLYAAEDMKNFKGKTVLKAGTLLATAETTVNETGEVQKAVFASDLPLGQYYVKELKAPIGYMTTKEKVMVDATYREDMREVIQISETVQNAPVQVQINLMDYFTEQELNGATLELLDEDGNSFTTILTAQDDQPVIHGLEIGKAYTLRELVSPKGYHYNPYLKEGYVTKQPDAVELEKQYPGGEVSDKITFTVLDEKKLQVVSVFNQPITGTVTVEKKGQVATGTEKKTDENGNVFNQPVYEIKGLPGAEYALVAKEDIVYPDGYTGTLFIKGSGVLDEYEAKKNTVLKNYQVEVPTGELLDVSGYIGMAPEPDATDAEVKAFYQEHQEKVQRSLPDGTAVHYVLRTDVEGKVQITGLPLGEYEVVEVKAPTGYYRDQMNCTQQLSLTEPEESGRTEEVVTAELLFQNEKQEVQEPENPDPDKPDPDKPNQDLPADPDQEAWKYGMAVTKYSLDGGIETPAAGAAFTVYAAEEIRNILGDVIYTEGTEIETAVSDKDGVARFQTDFPLGKYRVAETKAPKGHYSSKKGILFDLTEQKYNDGIHYLHYWNYVENVAAEVNVKLVDDRTEQKLADASLVITDEEGNPVEAWITSTEDGYTVKGLDPDKTYTITETVPRDGYLVDFTEADMKSDNGSMSEPKGNQVQFRLADVPAEVDETGRITKGSIPEKSEILLKNAMVVGNVRVNKDGEVLENWTLLDKVTNLVKSIFGYKKTGLEGVRFEVRTAEDIVHPDGVTGVVFHKGELVTVNVRDTESPAVAVTDETGTVRFEGMYLGRYELVETQTAEGYVRKTDPTVFSLAYVDGYTSPVSAEVGDINITNPRQKVQVTVTKTDADTGEKLSGSRIGLYTAEEIRNQKGTVITDADTLLETAKTDAEGKAVFEADLPFGRYYVKELKAPDGYSLNTEKQQFGFEYAGDSTETVEVALVIQDRKLPKERGHGHSGGSEDVIPVEAPMTMDEATLEFAILGVTAAILGLIMTKGISRKRNKKSKS